MKVVPGTSVFPLSETDVLGTIKSSINAEGVVELWTLKSY